jgi:peroxiredoxin
MAVLSLLGAVGPEGGETVAAEIAPDFTLMDTQGQEWTLSDVLAHPDTNLVVLEWWSPDCRFITKHHERFHTMVELEEEFHEDGVVWLAINSSSVASGLHDRQLCETKRQEYGMAYPVLLDTDGAVARAFKAKVTPHMFVIGKDGGVIYFGAIDDNPSETKAASRNFVRETILAALEGGNTPPATRAYGCAIKF